MDVADNRPRERWTQFQVIPRRWTGRLPPGILMTYPRRWSWSGWSGTRGALSGAGDRPWSGLLISSNPGWWEGKVYLVAASSADRPDSPGSTLALDPVARYRVYHQGMRSSEAAAAAGVNTQTLRYYERRGLLPEPARLESGYRAYGADAVRIVHFIKRAQQLGFTLEEIESLLELADGGPDNCDAAKQMAQEKLGQLQGKIASLSAMRESLQQLVETCVLPRARRECPLLDVTENAITGGSEGGT